VRVKRKEDRLKIKKELFGYLWKGRVEQACTYILNLIDREEDGLNSIKIENIKALEGRISI
jgi:hypothetical protein